MAYKHADASKRKNTQLTTLEHKWFDIQVGT